LLDQFYGGQTCILDGWIGIVGAFNNKGSEIVKLKRLLGKTISDSDLREVFPADYADDDLADEMDGLRDELRNPEVIIYCCAECGDRECGGIEVTIEKMLDTIAWTIKDENGEIGFSFDPYQYYEVLGNRLRKLQSSL
jgi:hypothetical protein